MASSLLAHTHAFVHDDWFATSSVTVHLPAALVVATASLSAFHAKDNATWPGANAWVSSYRQAGSTQDVDTLQSPGLINASDLLIEDCTRITFTVAVMEGYATLVGTVFGQDPIDRWVQLPDLVTRYVFDPATGKIRHTHAAIALDGAEVPDDDSLDAMALGAGLWFADQPEGSLDVVRGGGEPLPGQGLQVDVRTRELVADPDLDLPLRPWLRPRLG